MGQGDDTWHCPECHTAYDYYECSKRRDPRSSLFRTICGDCFERIVAEPSADQFTVSRNFRKAGPSHQAAQKAAKHAKMKDIHRHIWRYLRDHPATPGEVYLALHETHKIKLNTFRARITDLKDAGWIRDTGERRATELESTATVWAIIQQQESAA